LSVAGQLRGRHHFDPNEHRSSNTCLNCW